VVSAKQISLIFSVMSSWRFKGILATSGFVATASFNRAARCSSSVSSTTASADHTNSVPVIVLYQYKICPFCSRVKSYLDYLKIPYKSVEVNPLTKSQIKFSEEYKKVPLAQIDEELVADSANIIRKLTTLTKQMPSTSSHSTDFFPDDTDEWTEWSEKKLAVMLYPNITRSFKESWECFGYIADVEDWNAVTKLGTRALGSLFMAGANGKIKEKYGIVDERKELDLVLSQWTEALQGQYLHGDHITMPDIMVFGVLNAINQCQTFVDIMADNTRLRTWFESVKIALK
jgi:microsomal prostaglandin-E synthase 2